jgi:hypothetical protein
MGADAVTSPRRRNSHDENGSALLLSILFVTTMGVLAAALASYQVTLNRQSFTTKRIQTREASVNTAAEWAVNSLRSGREAFCQPGVEHRLTTLSNREVSVTCRPMTDAQRGTNTFAVYLHRSGDPALNAISTTGPLRDDALIIGPVYNGAGTAGWQLTGPLRIDGDVVIDDGAGDCESPRSIGTPTGVTASYVEAMACTIDLAAITPAPIPAPCANRSDCTNPEPVDLNSGGAPTELVPACRIFRPGYYTNPPALAATNYFAPGVYSFEFATEWSVNAALRGGDPAPATGAAAADPVISTIARCNGAPAPRAPYGVVFVFSGGARMQVNDTGRVELFSSNDADGLARPGIVAGRSPATPWASDSLLSLSTDLISVGTTDPEFVVHGGIWAPNSAVSLRGSAGAVALIRNTAVVARLRLQADDAGAPRVFGVRGRTGTAKSYFIRARSCPGPTEFIVADACTNPPSGAREPELCAVAAVTVYDDAKRTVKIDTWRVDRDPSPNDPASCTDPTP